MPENKFKPLGIIDDIFGTSFDDDNKEVDQSQGESKNLTFDDLLEQKMFESDNMIGTDVTPKEISKQAPSDEEVRISSEEFKTDQQNFSNYLDSAVFEPTIFSSLSETENMSVLYRNKNGELDDLVDEIYNNTKSNSFLQLEHSGFKNLKEIDQKDLIRHKVAFKANEYKNEQISSIDVKNILSLRKGDDDNAIIYSFNEETNDWDQKPKESENVVSAYEKGIENITNQDKQKNEYTKAKAEKDNGSISNKEYIAIVKGKVDADFKAEQIKYQRLVSLGIPAIPPTKNTRTFYDTRNVSGELKKVDITSEISDEENALDSMSPPTIETLYKDNVSKRLKVNVKNEVKSDYKISINNKAKNNLIGEYLADKGYESEVQSDGSFIFKQVKYSDITQWAEYIGDSGFFKDVVFGSKRDEIIPLDRKISQEDFIDELINYNEFSDDVEIKRQALSHIYLENRSIVDIDNGFFNVVANNTPGLKEVLKIQDERAVIDASVELMNQTGKQLTAEEEEKSYVGIDETLYESIPGLVGVVASMYVAGQIQNVAMSGRLLKGIYDAATKTRYFNSSGKLIKSIGEKAAKAGYSSVDAFAVASKFIPKAPTTLSKAKLQFVNLLFEDAKFALLLDGRLGEGASFSLASQGIAKLLPGSKDYRLRLVEKIFSSAGGFIAGSETSAVIGELIEDISGDGNFSKFIEEQYPEYLGGSSTERDFNKRLIVSGITGAALHISHMKKNDVTSDSELQGFLADTRVKKLDAKIKLNEYLKKNEIDAPTDPSQLGILSGKNPDLINDSGKEASKLVDNYTKHAELEALTVAEITTRADTKLYTDPVTRVKAYNDLLKPQVDYLKENYDFDLKIEVKEDASAESPKGNFNPKTNTLTINPLKASIGVVPHELSHVMKHVMFKGDIIAEGKFKNELETILKEVRLSDGSSLYEGIQRLIEPDKDGKVGLRKELEVEEMFSYGAEFMSEPGMYDYVRKTDAFVKMKKILSEDISGSSMKTSGDILEWMYEFSNTINSKYNPKKSFDKFKDIVDVLGAVNKVNSTNEKKFSREIDKELIDSSAGIQKKYLENVESGMSIKENAFDMMIKDKGPIYGNFTPIITAEIQRYFASNGLQPSPGDINNVSSMTAKVAQILVLGSSKSGNRSLLNAFEKYDPNRIGEKTGKTQNLTQYIQQIARYRLIDVVNEAMNESTNLGRDITDPKIKDKIDVDYLSEDTMYDFKIENTSDLKETKIKVETELEISPENTEILKTEIKEAIQNLPATDLTHYKVAKEVKKTASKGIAEALGLSYSTKQVEFAKQISIIRNNAARLLKLMPESIAQKTTNVTMAAKSFPDIYKPISRNKFKNAPLSMSASQKARGVNFTEKSNNPEVLIDAIIKPGDKKQETIKRIQSLVNVISGTHTNQLFRQILNDPSFQDILSRTDPNKFSNLRVENVMVDFKESLPDILFSKDLTQPKKFSKVESLVSDLGSKVSKYNMSNNDDIEKLKLDVETAFIEINKEFPGLEKNQMDLLSETLNNIVFKSDYKIRDVLKLKEQIANENIEAFIYIKNKSGEQIGSWKEYESLAKKKGIKIIKNKLETDIEKQSYEDFILKDLASFLPENLLSDKSIRESLFFSLKGSALNNKFTEKTKNALPKDKNLLPFKSIDFSRIKDLIVTYVKSDKTRRTSELPQEFIKRLRNSISKKGYTYDQTIEANSYAQKILFNGLYEYLEKNSNNYEKAISNVYTFLEGQHSSQTGAVRSLAFLESISLKKFDVNNIDLVAFDNWFKKKIEKEDGKFKILSYSRYDKIDNVKFENLTNDHKRSFIKSRLYAEHAFQTFNFSTNFLEIAFKHRGKKDKFNLDFNKLSENYKTGIIQSALQKRIDSTLGGGKLGNKSDNSNQDVISNIINNRKTAETTFMIKTGKSLEQTFKEIIGIKVISKEVNAVSKAFAEKVKLLGEKPSISDAENIDIIREAEQKSKNKKLEEVTRNSEELSKELNTALENKFGVPKEKVYSKIEASKLGSDANKLKVLAWSAQDFRGLLQPLKGRGVVGDAAENWIQKNLVRPFAIANRNIDADRVAMTNDFAALKKELKGLIPDLTSKANIEGLSKNIFSNQDAVRVYIWNKQGNTATGLNEGQVRRLSEYVSSNEKLEYFANKLIELSKGEGYVEPGENWETGTITTDLLKGLNENGRAKHLEEWQANVDVIFSEDNLNKIQAILGSNHREALENSLERMKSGRNKINMFSGKGARLENLALDWLNNSVGAIMFLNSRSAALQTLSSINYINWSDNNVLAAGKAIANQKQYWKDFTTIFNSDFLVERRGGLKINVSESEIADAAAGSKNKIRGALSYLLQKGFAPTKYADSFAIATGGATFYRNRLNRYLKQGLNEQSAKNRAFEDFREVTEQSQQSSRPDLISQQQASTLGRLVLAFGNTPAQYVRIMDKSLSDLRNGRGDWKEHVSKIIYYSTVQNLMFSAAQNALFVGLFDETDDITSKKKHLGLANSVADGLLRGMGVAGAAVSTAKNIVLEIHKQNNKKKTEFKDVGLRLLDMSPPVDSKIGKLRSAGLTFDYNMDEIKDKGFSLKNPAYLAGGQVMAGTFNIPLDRVFRKYNNIEKAFDTDTDNWKRPFLMMGWSEWELHATEEQRKGSKFKAMTKKQKIYRNNLKIKLNLNDEEVEEYINNRKNK